MSERSKNTVFVTLIAALSIALMTLTLSYETPDDRVERLGSAIKCPVCQGESIANSPAPMARDMMALVAERVEQGADDQAIIAELLGSFTGAVLLDPPLSGSTLFLWIAPIAAFAIGVAVIWWWWRHPGTPIAQSRRLVDSATSWTPRRLGGGLLLMGGFVAVILVAGAFVRDRADNASGAAEAGIESLDDVSNETMEAVIAASLDNPQINGMRLALAERYFSAGDYQAAFPHYLSVAESDSATAPEASTALIGLGWMAYDGNGEIEAATSLFDQALALTPRSPIALYLKGQVLWCGAADTESATDLFRQVLELNDLSEETRSQVQLDLELASTGASCP